MVELGVGVQALHDVHAAVEAGGERAGLRNIVAELQLWVAGWWNLWIWGLQCSSWTSPASLNRRLRDSGP